VELANPAELLVREYLQSGDVEECAKNMKATSDSFDQAYFVKKAVFTAMDKQAYERELVSKLLSSLYSRVLSPKEIEAGFELALDGLEDISLDIPDAPDLLAKFLARAVVDEIIPPAFLTHAAKAPQPASAKARNAINLANGLINEHHRGERLAHVWGPGDLKSVKRLKEEVRLLLLEFVVNQDLSEADQSLRKLNAPSFHFQVVKLAIRIMLEKNSPDSTARIAKLLKYFVDVGLISLAHVVKGFSCCFDSLDDLKLDYPNADKQLVEFVQLAKSEGWLPSDYSPPQPRSSVPPEAPATAPAAAAAAASSSNSS